MTTPMRKHLAEIQAIATEMQAALDRGELPTIFDANILEYRAKVLAVDVRAAFIATLVEVPSGSAEDKAAQRYIERERVTAGIAGLLDDTEPVTSNARDQRVVAAE